MAPPGGGGGGGGMGILLRLQHTPDDPETHTNDTRHVHTSARGAREETDGGMRHLTLHHEEKLDCSQHSTATVNTTGVGADEHCYSQPAADRT